MGELLSINPQESKRIFIIDLKKKTNVIVRRNQIGSRERERERFQLRDPISIIESDLNLGREQFKRERSQERKWSEAGS